MSLLGILVVQDPRMLQVRVWFTVDRWPTRKRRKAWRVTRREQLRPSAKMIGGALFCHPTIYKMLQDSL